MPHASDSNNIGIRIIRYLFYCFDAYFSSPPLRQHSSEKRECQSDKIQFVLFDRYAIVVVNSGLNKQNLFIHRLLLFRV